MYMCMCEQMRIGKFTQIVCIVRGKWCARYQAREHWICGEQRAYGNPPDSAGSSFFNSIAICICVSGCISFHSL